MSGAIVKRLIKIKGGPGSGHRGHGGRPGSVGGSTAGISAGFEMSTWLAGQRKRMPTPVRDAIEKEVAAFVKDKYPDQSAERIATDVDMYVDVMALDRERFTHYANKLGLNDVDKMADDFFKEEKGASQELKRRMYDMQKRLTYPNDGDRSVTDELHNKVNSGNVGKNWQEASSILSDEYGVTVDIKRAMGDEALHEQLSWTINAARSNPMIDQVIRNELDTIRIGGSSPGHETATASAGYRHMNLHSNSEEWRSPLTIVHELGHVHSYEDKTYVESRLFGRGRHTSSYGWTNYDEDYAETFVAAVAGSLPHREWVPEKYDHIVNSFAEELR